MNTWKPIPSPLDVPTCGICQQPANQACGGCKAVYYCCRAHQKEAWREGHKFKCCAFKVQYTDSLGRHMVASRDIKAGEMILKEKPALCGPRMSTPPMCLGCNAKLKPQSVDGKKLDYYKCSSCHWPLCGPECEASDAHKPECEIMTKMKYKCSITYEGQEKSEAAYCVIAPVRILLMKEQNPKQFENIMNLESHLEERIITPLYTVLKANLVTFVVQILGMDFSEDTVLTAASILDTNSFDVRSADGIRRCRALYVTASMMNHDCKPNTRHVFLEKNTMAVIATFPIAKGELITAGYTQTFQGTLDRRRHLYSAKCFFCECERCMDPTEFGSYIGSIYCSVCNGPGGNKNLNWGAMMVSTNPLDEAAVWKCEKCDHTIASKQILWGNNALVKDLNQLDKNNPGAFEEYIGKYRQTLHPKNYHLVQAKYVLSQLYGNVPGFLLSELSDQLLQRKIDICNELLELAEVLEPGLSRIRGVLLLDLQAAMTVQTKREFEADKITKAAAQGQLSESLAILHEATDILRLEPNMKETLENRIQELADLIEEDEIVQEDGEINNNDCV